MRQLVSRTSVTKSSSSTSNVFSRSEAKRLGMSHYCTGKLCKNGHLDKRLTSTGQCLTCCSQYQARYLSEDPERIRANARRSYANNIDVGRARSQKYYAENKSRLVVYKATYNHENRHRWSEIAADRRLNDPNYRLRKS